MGVTQEASQQRWLALYGVGGAARLASEAGQIEGRIVGEPIGFEVGPQVLNRVEFGGIGREVLKVRRAGRDAFIDQLTQMSSETIPDQHHGAAQLALQMLEEVHDAHGVDVVVGEHAKVQCQPIAGRSDAQRRDCRDFLMSARALTQHRGVSEQAPGATHQRGHQQARFVQKDDCGSQAGSVFFTRGQSCSIQARMRCSSRSTARPVGFWGEKPRPCSKRLTCAG